MEANYLSVARRYLAPVSKNLLAMAEMLCMGAEKRVEPRIKSKGRVALLASGAEPIAATICNVSLSGIGLEAERGLEVGTVVRLDTDAVEASGVVCYCAAQDGVYRIGVAIDPVN